MWALYFKGAEIFLLTAEDVARVQYCFPILLNTIPIQLIIILVIDFNLTLVIAACYLSITLQSNHNGFSLFD